MADSAGALGNGGIVVMGYAVASASFLVGVLCGVAVCCIVVRRKQRTLLALLARAAQRHYLEQQVKERGGE